MAAAVVHPFGWSADLWKDDYLESVDRVISIGRLLRSLTPRSSRREVSSIDNRQLDALGDAHDHLRQLAVAIVGCGGTGSPLAEQLVRMGVRRCLLIDHDHLDTASNVRRVFGSTAKDLEANPPRAKVDVVGSHLDRLDLGVGIERVVGDVRTEEVFRRLLDVDVVMCATDSHSSRAVLNELPSIYLTPVIDVSERRRGKRYLGC